MKKLKIAALLLAAVVILAGCGSNTNVAESPAQAETEAAVEVDSQEAAVEEGETESLADAAEDIAEAVGEEVAEEDIEGTAAALTDAEAPEIDGLEYDHTMELKAATGFHVYYYKDGYKLIDVPLSGQYLIIPEGKEAPDGLPIEIYKVYQPLTQVYMAATGSMSFVEQIDAMDCVTMSSLDEKGWMIEAPIKAMQEGTLTFAGKYSEPDYEMMVGKGCDLAIESTMILHSPEVQEMIEDLGIPVFIDRSSYELDAFGRIEWIKAYGAMFNKEELAEEKFEEQEAVLGDIKDFENTGKTVAFFAVNSNKTVTVRRTEDFIPNMIELAGGKYIFENLDNPGSNSASVRMSFEEFYNSVVDADYLVYNGTIEEPLSSIEDLLAKNELFSEFKAVKEGNVWTVDKTWYQSTATIGYLITDFNRMVTDGNPEEMVFLHKVD